jgi:hypothetical protein
VTLLLAANGRCKIILLSILLLQAVRLAEQGGTAEVAVLEGIELLCLEQLLEEVALRKTR